MIDWRPDVLGDEFECVDIDLGEDFEGPVLATLVRALPSRRGFWDRLFDVERELEDCDVLYVHGWSDYFFQTHVARYFTARGARFYALDLRKYGRSLREGQTSGYIEDLAEYDQEIEAALTIMRGEASAGHSGSRSTSKPRRLILFGHSTGGLILSLWADRHRGVADALLLNSPWLELQLSSVARRIIAPVVNMRARFSPHEVALPQLDMGFYAQAQRKWSTPEQLAQVNPEWRPEPSMPVRVAWLRAIFKGQGIIEGRIDVGAPVCVLLSTKSQLGLTWHDDMLHADTVLEVEGVARACLKLGSSVTVERIHGALHDIFISESSVREYAFTRMGTWLRGWHLTAPQAAQHEQPEVLAHEERAEPNERRELVEEHDERPMRGDHSGRSLAEGEGASSEL